MKKYMFISFLLLAVAAVPLLSRAQGRSSMDEALANFDRMAEAIDVNAVIGEPIRVQDTIIVPFSKISYGLGAGGATMGFGGGMGGKAIPLGILIIQGEEVKVELFPLEEKKPSLIQELLPVLFKMLPEILGGKFPVPGTPPGESSAPRPDSSGITMEDVESLYEAKRYQEALKAVETLISVEPKNAEYHAWKGTILGTLSQDGGPADMIKYGMGAMQAFEKALQLDPDNVRARFGRGIGRLMAPEGFGGDVDGAIQDIKSALKEPFPEGYYYLGVAYQKKGMLDQAKEAFLKALDMNPDYKEARKALEEIKRN